MKRLALVAAALFAMAGLTGCAYYAKPSAARYGYGGGPTLATNWRASHKIILPRTAGNAHGSGFAVSSEGHILTMHHVVDDEPMLMVTIKEGGRRRIYFAEVVATDKMLDIAVIKIPHRFQHTVLISDTDPVLGERLYGIGFPFAYDQVMIRAYVMRTGFPATVVDEETRVTKTHIPDASYIWFPAGHGISGAPLFSERDHRVLGMTGVFRIFGHPLKINKDGKTVRQGIPAMAPAVLVPASAIRAFLDKHRIPYRRQ